MTQDVSRRPRGRIAGSSRHFSRDGKVIAADQGLAGEYPRLYTRSASLCSAARSEVDWRPFQLVADAFLIGERRIAAAAHPV